jgi:hypothetical protein
MQNRRGRAVRRGQKTCDQQGAEPNGAESVAASSPAEACFESIAGQGLSLRRRVTIRDKAVRERLSSCSFSPALILPRGSVFHDFIVATASSRRDSTPRDRSSSQKTPRRLEAVATTGIVGCVVAVPRCADWQRGDGGLPAPSRAKGSLVCATIRRNAPCQRQGGHVSHRGPSTRSSHDATDACFMSLMVQKSPILVPPPPSECAVQHRVCRAWGTQKPATAVPRHQPHGNNAAGSPAAAAA